MLRHVNWGPARRGVYHGDAVTFPAVNTFLQDIRDALRTSRRRPALTLVIVASLAIGMTLVDPVVALREE